MGERLAARFISRRLHEDFVNYAIKLLGEINLAARGGKPAKRIVLRVQVKKKQRENGWLRSRASEERERESARFNERAASRHAELFDPVIGASGLRVCLAARSLGQHSLARQAASSDLAADRAVAPSARSPSQPLVPAQGKTSS